MLKKILIGLAVVIVAIPVVALAPKSVTSGLEVGEVVTPFHPNHVSGPHKGTDACPPCTYGNRPQVQIWVHGDKVADVMKFAQVLDKKMAADDQFKGFVIFLTADEANVGRTLAADAKKANLERVSLATLAKTSEYVKNYKMSLAPEVKNTILVYKDKKVATKFVNLKADEQGLASLRAAVNKIAP